MSPSQKGGLWVGTSAGLTWFDPSAGTSPMVTYAIANAGLKNEYIKGVFEARNGDVYAVDGAMNVKSCPAARWWRPMPTRAGRSSHGGDSQGVVLAVAGELFRVGTNYFTPYPFKNNPKKPSMNWVFNMITAQGRLPLGCEQRDGICRIKDGTYKLWTKDDGLRIPRRSAFAKTPDGSIWGGLESGLVRIRNGQARNITRQNGLFDNIIYNIVPDAHGALSDDLQPGIFPRHAGGS